MTKRFNIRKIKTVVYSRDILNRAEHYFPEFENIDYSEEIDLKKNDYFMVTSVCKYNNTRYKGIQRLDYEGIIDPEGGINMDCEEWSAFVNDYPKIKEEWAKKPRGAFKRKSDHRGSPSDVATFEWQWVVGNAVVKKSDSAIHYSEESAKDEAQTFQPVRGEDYPSSDDEDNVLLEINCVYRAPPFIPEHMLLCYLTLLESQINELRFKNCVAHQDGETDSQVPHTRSGNCLDESIDFVEMYFDKAKNMVPVSLLVSVFASCRARIRARSAFCTQAAQSVKWLMPDFLLKQKIKKGFAGAKLLSLKKVINTANMAIQSDEKMRELS